jgi:hypothetical protein
MVFGLTCALAALACDNGSESDDDAADANAADAADAPGERDAAGSGTALPDAALPDAALPDAALPDAVPGATVTARVRLVELPAQRPFVGAEVTWDGQAGTTDETGTAAVEVTPGAPFAIRATGATIPESVLVGAAGDADFTYTSFVSTEAFANQLFGASGVDWPDGTGVLVVGLDQPSLAPAAGATATIDAAVEGRTLGAAGLVVGNAASAASGLVVFVGVPAGTVTLTTTAPSGDPCTHYPGRTPIDTVDVAADAWTVVTTVCE